MTSSSPTSGAPRPTLDDVARAAGVSRATASRVIAGHGPASAAAREQVSAAAARLGYTPNAVARALVNGGGVRVVVAVTAKTASALNDPYLDRLVSAAATLSTRHGLGVSLQWLPLDAPQQIRRLATDRSVHGVVLVNTTEQLLQAVPASLTGRIASIGAGSRTVPSFDVDTGRSTTAMVRHLYAGGRRRIAMVSGPTWLPCNERSREAYRVAMAAAGLPIRLVPGDFTAAGGSAAALAVLRRWPDTDAVLADSDAMALGAIAALRKLAVDVPGDVAVTGFDDIPFAALSTPALTTGSHPVDRIAASAAGAVIAGDGAPPETLYASELISRDSA